MTDIDPTPQPNPRYEAKIMEGRVVYDPVLVCKLCGCAVHADLLPVHDQWHVEVSQ